MGTVTAVGACAARTAHAAALLTPRKYCGRKPKLNAAKAATVRRLYQATGPDGKRLHSVAEIGQAVGVHRTTVYDYLKKEG
jgi:hypothetical protein